MIKAAAVSDFCAAEVAPGKVKKEAAQMQLPLARTPDILAELGRRKADHNWLLIGFAAESGDLEAEGRRKLAAKNLDLIAVNSISSPDTGFAANTNQLLLINQQGSTQLPLTSKEQTANLLWDTISGTLLR